MEIGKNMTANQRGVTYLWMLFLVFLLGLVLGRFVEIYSTETERQKEAELLLIGDQYREAIKQYYQSAPGYQKKYPEKLTDMLKDSRYLTTRRYLRQLYQDPVTNQPFTTIPAPDGGVMGVMSPSSKPPVKLAGFSKNDSFFTNAKRISDWQFLYIP